MVSVKSYIKCKKQRLQLRRRGCLFRTFEHTEKIYVSCDLQNSAQLDRAVVSQKVLEFSLNYYRKLKSAKYQNLWKLVIIKNSIRLVKRTVANSTNLSLCPCDDDEGFWMESDEV